MREKNHEVDGSLKANMSEMLYEKLLPGEVIRKLKILKH